MIFGLPETCFGVLPGSSFLQTGPRGEARTAIWLQSWAHLDAVRYAVWECKSCISSGTMRAKLTMSVWWANSQFTCPMWRSIGRKLWHLSARWRKRCQHESCPSHFYRFVPNSKVLLCSLQLPGARRMWLLLGCSSHRRLGDACRDGPPKGNWCAIFKSGDGSVRDEWGRNTYCMNYEWWMKHLDSRCLWHVVTADWIVLCIEVWLCTKLQVKDCSTNVHHCGAVAPTWLPYFAVVARQQGGRNHETKNCTIQICVYFFKLASKCCDLIWGS